MLIGACVCPHPPLLVPEVAGRAAAEIEDLRSACLDGVRRLAALRPALIRCIGTGAPAGEWGESAGGSMRSFGVDVAFGGPDVVLAPALTIGAYLLDAIGWTGARRYVTVDSSTTPADAAALGRNFAGSTQREAFLVLGDGSAKRSTEAPGYLDERAQEYDAALVRALSLPDPVTLATLDPVLADDLWVAGRPAWQVLAGTAGQTEGARITTTVRYDQAPYGVGYWVVDWMVDPNRDVSD